MGRLIDADHLLFLLNSAIELRKKLHRNTSDLDMMVGSVNDEPTAYDLDKVVEQLEDYSNADEAERIGTIPVIELDDAIKIVKGGGVDA